MPEDPPPISLNKEKAPAKTNTRRISSAPYLLTLLASFALLAWYFLAYFPSQLQYFLNLRYRALAVLAQQIQSKIEGIEEAVDTAANGAGADAKDYLKLFIPELRIATPPPAGKPAAASVLFTKGTLTMEMSWSDIMTRTSTATVFSDLLIAERGGKVVWQREEYAPKIGNLAEIVNIREQPSLSWFPASIGSLLKTTPPQPAEKDKPIPSTTSSVVVNLDGVWSLVMIQPIRASSTAEHRAFVVGVVPIRELQKQAMFIPAGRIVVFALPFCILLLFVPFIKIATVTPRERYRFRDILICACSTILATALAGALAFTATPSNPRTDLNLATLAAEIDEHLSEEARRTLAFIRHVGQHDSELGDKLADCKVPLSGPYAAKKSCGLWSAVAAVNKGRKERKDTISTLPEWIDLDVLFWLDDNGEQIRKWTTKSQVTAGVNVRNYGFFSATQAGNLWSLQRDKTDPKNSDPFIIEPLRSPTTSEPAFLFSIPNSDVPRAEPTASSGKSLPPPRMVVANVRPRSLVDPLIPPEYGFAIIDEKGKVLFHSQKELSLAENLFEEVSSPSTIRAAAISRSSTITDLQYHGRPFRIYVKPVTGIGKCPWTIVAFREMQPVLTFAVRQGTGAALLFLINVLIFSAMVAAIVIVYRLNGQEVKDVLVTLCRTHWVHQDLARRAMAIWIFLTIVAFGVLWYTQFAHHDELFTCYLFFVVLPLLVIVGQLYRRNALLKISSRDNPNRGSTSIASRHLPLLRAMELCLWALLIGFLPMAGFASIVYRVDEFARTLQWLKQIHSQVDARYDRIRLESLHVEKESGIPVPTSFTNEAFEIVHKTKDSKGNDPLQECETERVHSYLQVLRSACFPKKAAESPAAESGWITRWVASLRSNLVPGESKAEDGSGSTFTWAGPNRIQLKAADNTVLVISYRPAVSWNPRWMCGACALLAFVFWLIWSSMRKLQFRRPEEAGVSIARDQYELDQFIGRTKSAVLLIGVPRLRKDTAVCKAIPAKDSVRIRLQDQTTDASWVAQAREKVEQLDQRCCGENGRSIWVHISNLEAKLGQRESRSEILGLLEHLLNATTWKVTRRTVIITSAIDPILHLAEIFADERREASSSSAPELELKRWSLLLSKLSRCHYKAQGRNPWPYWLRYQPTEWRATLHAEAEGHPALAEVETRLLNVFQQHESLPIDLLKYAIRDAAEAYYHLLWTSCTQSEKLLLIQLAQENVVNPQNIATLEELVSKGLVTLDPTPLIFNCSFRDFLGTVESREVIRRWETTAGAGAWVLVGNVLAYVTAIGATFFLLTQGLEVSNVVTLVTASGILSLPLTKDVFNKVLGRLPSAK